MLIGGQERPIRFGMNTYILYCELNNCSITKMGADLERIGKGEGTGAEIRDIVWAALKDGARKAKEEFNHDNFEVGDWLDDIDQGQLKLFFEELGKSMADRIPDDRKVDSKKKVKLSSQ